MFLAVPRLHNSVVCLGVSLEAHASGCTVTFVAGDSAHAGVISKIRDRVFVRRGAEQGHKDEVK